MVCVKLIKIKKELALSKRDKKNENNKLVKAVDNSEILMDHPSQCQNQNTIDPRKKW